MTTPNRWQVGDTVMYSGQGRRNEEVVITRIGRVYVYAKVSGREKAFDIRTGRISGSYHTESITPIDEWKERQFRAALDARCWNFGVRFCELEKISTLKLERITAILEEE